MWQVAESQKAAACLSAAGVSFNPTDGDDTFQAYLNQIAGAKLTASQCGLLG